MSDMSTQPTGLKFDQDKARMDLLDPYAIEQLALVLGFGAKKYAAHNWRGGIQKSRLISAALRHLFAYLKGEDRDPETGLSHAAHAMCCCMFLLGLEHRLDLDDRYQDPQGRAALGKIAAPMNPESDGPRPMTPEEYRLFISSLNIKTDTTGE